MAFQVTAPLLDGCVLAVLEQGDAYGYNLTQQLRREIDLSESTLYPVLRRLQRDGHLTVYDEQFQGRNRKYYRMTEPGRGYYQMLVREWQAYQDQIAEIIRGQKGADDEQGTVYEAVKEEAAASSEG